MNSDVPLELQSLEKFPVCMTKEMVAKALGIATHNIPPLVRAGLLKPLGRPAAYCVKYFSRKMLAEYFSDEEWLDKVVAAISRHWRSKNARRRSRLTGKRPVESNNGHMPDQTEVEAGESVTR